MPKPKIKMKEAKDLLKKVEKIVDIPKTLHPDSNPEDAIRVGQEAGVIRLYAQNGAIWDLILADGSKRQVHQQDMLQVVCGMILEEDEKSKAQVQKVEPEPVVEEEVEEEPQPEPEPEPEEEAVEKVDEEDLLEEPDEELHIEDSADEEE